jgi:hypothetical protein
MPLVNWLTGQLYHIPVIDRSKRQSPTPAILGESPKAPLAEAMAVAGFLLFGQPIAGR